MSDMDDNWTYRTLQAQHKIWVLHNFGEREPWQPLLGMAEEIAELNEALGSSKESEVRDALADIMIFMADFATAMGMDLQSLHDRALCPVSLNEPAQSLIGGYGHAARGFLKLKQGIRGTPEQHLERIREGLTTMLRRVLSIAGHRKFVLRNVVRNVWEMEVQPRDWKLYPDTGRPPAPQAPL